MNTQRLQQAANSMVQTTEANLLIVLYNLDTGAMSVQPWWEAPVDQWENSDELLGSALIAFADEVGAGASIGVVAYRDGVS